MSTANILVVDDNELNQLVAEGHLSSLGYAVTLASSGREALDLFERGRFDLVLLDIMMPGMDGFETCSRLRELPRGDTTPIVFLTALNDLDTHGRAIAAGAEDFLGKPISGAELLIRVRSLLRLKTLRDEISASNQVIAAQRDALIEAQERKRELNAMLVHDLKNPLASVSMNAQYVLESGVLTGDHREALEDIHGSCEAMMRMVMDLLDVDRSVSGHLLPRLREADVRAMLEECAHDLRARSRDSGRTIEVSVDAEVPTPRVDPELLARTLANLAENALKYSPRGSTIHLRARRSPDGNVRLSVHDSGPGVPVEKRRTIFEPYSRLDRDADLHANSSRGLGLAFCRLAVEAHGGSIWIEDEPNTGGAVFCIELPVNAEFSSGVVAVAS